jgi:hypothetical protein
MPGKVVVKKNGNAPTIADKEPSSLTGLIPFIQA